MFVFPLPYLYRFMHGWQRRSLIPRMANTMLHLLLLATLVTVSGAAATKKAPPATFVLGDSLVDVGNNNYLTFTLAVADHKPYGIDRADQKPTGRFCNGKIIPDLVSKFSHLDTIEHDALLPLEFQWAISLLLLTGSFTENCRWLSWDSVSFACVGSGGHWC